MKRRIKHTCFKVKSTLLLRLFGIKPKRNTLKLNRIQVEEREITPESFNNWSKSVLSNQ
jgi:hypothetical protein